MLCHSYISRGRNISAGQLTSYWKLTACHCLNCSLIRFNELLFLWLSQIQVEAMQESANLSIHVCKCNGYRNILPPCYVIAIFQGDETCDHEVLITYKWMSPYQWRPPILVTS